MSPLVAAIPSPPFDRIVIGPFTFRLYGLAIAVGVLAAYRITERRYRGVGGDPADLRAVATWAVPAGLVGARLYHVATDWHRFRGAWLDALAVWEGGLGIWGAVAGGTAVAWFVARRRDLRFDVLADAAAPALPVGQAIGRLGNWFNQELFGRPSDLPWALRIDVEHRPASFGERATFHPTFLYEAGWNLALALLLVVAERRWRLDRGRLFALYVAGYTAGRLWIELLRVDPATHVLGARINVWTSIAVLLGAIAVFVRVDRRAETGAARVGDPPG